VRARRPATVSAWAAAAVLVLVPIAQGQASPEVEVSVDRPRITTNLGGKFTFESTIENIGAAPAERLIAHLNVLSLRSGTYVDPEDWSSERTRYLEPVPPGGSVTARWEMQAVNDGVFAIYVAVLSDDAAPVPPVTAPAIRLDVTERRTLNPEGMVPVALGVPLLVGLLAVFVRLRRRG